MKLAKNEFTGSLETAVEENRPEKGFERVRQSGGTLAPAVNFFASTQDEMLAEPELAGVFGKSATIDQLGASFGERAFAKGREILVELPSENELEDSVTEKFEALVGLHGNALFVRDGGMSQSKPQESRITKSVTELILEIVIVGHGDQKIPNSKLQTSNKSQVSNSNFVSRIPSSEFGIWNLFGIWDLGFGIFIRLALRKRAGEGFRVRPEQVAGPAG